MASRNFEEDLLSTITDPRSKIAVVAMLERWRGLSIYLPARPKNARRQQAAARMLENGMAPGDIAAALRQRFGICERQARRDIQQARAKVGTKV